VIPTLAAVGVALSCELDVVDCFGNTVHLDHSNWEKHLDRHPDVVPYHDQLPLVLQVPQIVVKAEVDGAYHFYRLRSARVRCVRSICG